jgi:hypothetical protein
VDLSFNEAAMEGSSTSTINFSSISHPFSSGCVVRLG